MRFGQYELLERVATGGMAEVYRGRAAGAEGFEKWVAIKRILPEYATDERFISMLLTEARIHSALSHRNIVQIHDLGISEDGEYFIVLEYVEGHDLRAIMEAAAAHERRIPDALALHIVDELAQALHFAHELRGADGNALGIVHRDVSPSNVLVSNAGEVKLSDFGIAKRRHDHSVFGSLKGNLVYMPPEQARGLPLDRRADLFALGAVLFEMLTGHKVREINDEVNGLREVASGVLRSARELRPDLPEPIAGLLDRVLAVDPDDRFPDAAAFGTAVRELRREHQIPAGPTDLQQFIREVSPPRRARSPVERSKIIRLAPEFRVPSGAGGVSSDRATAERPSSVHALSFDPAGATPPPPPVPGMVPPRVSRQTAPLGTVLLRDRNATGSGQIHASSPAEPGGEAPPRDESAGAPSSAPPGAPTPPEVGGVRGRGTATPGPTPPIGRRSPRPSAAASGGVTGAGARGGMRADSAGDDPAALVATPPPVPQRLPARPPAFGERAASPTAPAPAVTGPGPAAMDVATPPPPAAAPISLPHRLAIPDFAGAGAAAVTAPLSAFASPPGIVEPPRRSRWPAFLLGGFAMTLLAAAGLHFFVMPLDVLLVWQKPAWLWIESEPAGARAVYDGRALLEPTPTRVQVRRDRSEHVIELSAAGHGPVRQVVRLDRSYFLGASVQLPALASETEEPPTPSRAEASPQVEAAGAGGANADPGEPSPLNAAATEAGEPPSAEAVATNDATASTRPARAPAARTGAARSRPRSRSR